MFIIVQRDHLCDLFKVFPVQKSSQNEINEYKCLVQGAEILNINLIYKEYFSILI